VQFTNPGPQGQVRDNWLCLWEWEDSKFEAPARRTRLWQAGIRISDFGEATPANHALWA